MSPDVHRRWSRAFPRVSCQNLDRSFSFVCRFFNCFFNYYYVETLETFCEFKEYFKNSSVFLAVKNGR